MGRLSGVLREPGQHRLGGPSCPETMLQHQKIPQTKLVLRALAHTLAVPPDRFSGRTVRCAVGAKWVQLPLRGARAAAPRPPTLAGSVSQHTVGIQPTFAQDLALSSR